jgi:hypothetical protein
MNIPFSSSMVQNAESRAAGFRQESESRAQAEMIASIITAQIRQGNDPSGA